jgi:hypothetical protein
MAYPNFEAPGFVKPDDYSFIPRSIDDLFNAYTRAKTQGQMQQRQDLEDRLNYGAPLSQLNESHIQEFLAKKRQAASLATQKTEAEIYKDKAAGAKDFASLDPRAGGLKPENRAQIEGQIMDDYLKSPTFTNLAAAKSSLRDLASIKNNKSGAGDIAAIYGFVKTMDPNAVKEGEIALTQSALPGFDRVRVIFDSLKSGNKITPEMKRELLTVAKGMYDAKHKTAEEFRTPFINRARQYGINPDIAAPSMSIPDAELAEMTGDSSGYEEVQLKDARGGLRTALYNGPKFVGWK